MTVILSFSYPPEAFLATHCAGLPFPKSFRPSKKVRAILFVRGFSLSLSTLIKYYGHLDLVFGIFLVIGIWSLGFDIIENYLPLAIPSVLPVGPCGHIFHGIAELLMVWYKQQNTNSK